MRRLNEIVDYSAWKTKTPEATIRRIVQVSKQFFRIQPMTNHTIFFSTLLLLADLVVAQEPQEFSSPNEKEDSLSSLSVIPLKSA